MEITPGKHVHYNHLLLACNFTVFVNFNGLKNSNRLCRWLLSAWYVLIWILNLCISSVLKQLTKIKRPASEDSIKLYVCRRWISILNISVWFSKYIRCCICVNIFHANEQVGHTREIRALCLLPVTLGRVLWCCYLFQSHVSSVE